MALPEEAGTVIVGAGIHGLSVAWRLAERLSARGTMAENSVVVLDKSRVGAGASGIACGVVRNNYFQSAMRELMVHSIEVWESDADGFAYHPVGYMQISPEVMRADVTSVYEEQRAIGYESEFIEGENAAARYMRGLFGDWRAKGITSVLHEKRGGYANNMRSMRSLAAKAEAAGAKVIGGVTVREFISESGSKAIAKIVTDRGTTAVDQVVLAPGPWVRDLWSMLSLPAQIRVKNPDGSVDDAVPMWRFWQLEEGVLRVPPTTLLTDDGRLPPVVHVDSTAPLYSDVDGSLITDEMWGIYYKPDFHFNGVQGGSAPYEIDRPAGDIAIDPYGPESPEFVSGPDFSKRWCAALSHCHARFEGKSALLCREPAGGIGCFTPDSFPVFDRFCDNAYVVADSNHGYKMIGVGRLVADELLGETQALLKPFRFKRFALGETFPVSSSPFPWS